LCQFAAVNGPAIGAAVTSAALCDAVLCSETATLHTPFTQLGMTPEGCSSFTFPRCMGEEGARAMLVEGRKLAANEALALGLATEVVASSEQGPEASAAPSTAEEVLRSALVRRALVVAAEWVREGRPRANVDITDQLRSTNRRESQQLADSFFQTPFLDAQYRFAKDKKKTGPMWFFWVAKHVLPPVVSRL
jgi:enoyl-CoA hydratase/carnithine racemase